MRAMVLMGVLALSGCAMSAGDRGSYGSQERAARELADALKGRVAGEPQDCISASSTSGPQIIDERTLIYRDVGKVWRNDLESSCPGLDPGDTLVVVLHGSQMCRRDLFHVREYGSSIPGPRCQLGKFTPYRKQ